MIIDSGAMYVAGTPTVAIPNAAMGTPRIMYPIICLRVSNGISRTMFNAAVIKGRSSEEDVAVDVDVFGAAVVDVLLLLVVDDVFAKSVPRSPRLSTHC